MASIITAQPARVVGRARRAGLGVQVSAEEDDLAGEIGARQLAEDVQPVHVGLVEELRVDVHLHLHRHVFSRIRTIRLYCSTEMRHLTAPASSRPLLNTVPPSVRWVIPDRFSRPPAFTMSSSLPRSIATAHLLVEEELVDLVLQGGRRHPRAGAGGGGGAMAAFRPP